MSSQVVVSKGLLAGLVGVAAAAVIGVVFLLGRASVRVPPVETPKSTDGSAGAATAVPAVPEPALPSPVPPGWPPAPEPQAAPPAPIAAKPAVIAAPRTDPARAAVAAYFKAIESIQPETAGNPETVAMQITSGLGNGDPSGIDGMIQQAMQTRSRLAALSPPQPCAGYHRDLLASLDESLGLMRSIKQAFSSPNPSLDANTLTDAGKALKSRSDSLRSQEKALKQRYCE